MFTLGKFNHIVEAVTHGFVSHLIDWKPYAISCSSGASPAPGLWAGHAGCSSTLSWLRATAARHPPPEKQQQSSKMGHRCPETLKLTHEFYVDTREHPQSHPCLQGGHAHLQSHAGLKARGWWLGLLCFVQGMS